MKNIRVGLAFLIVSILMGCGSAPKKHDQIYAQLKAELLAGRRTGIKYSAYAWGM